HLSHPVLLSHQHTYALFSLSLHTLFRSLAAVSAAICAAYGVDFLEPLNPRPPALAHERAFPCVSVSVTIVLLKDDWMCACPRSTFFLTRFFVTFFATFLAI